MNQKIQRRKLADEVFDRLHEMITTGELKPGDKMPSERELTETLGVGRVAIREAMQSLDKIGLIQIAHGERARVTVPTARGMFEQIDVAARHMISASDDNLEQLKAARHFFETALVREAVVKASDTQKAEMRVLLAEQHKHVGDPVAFVNADMAFHICIAEMSNNPILVSVARAMLDWLFERHSELVTWTGKEHFTLAEHELIAGCIESADIDGSVKAMSDHINRSSELYQNQ